ncbi:hypothetical protein B296_00055926 [Ensete ventricosum]|uniref:Uncharacterized protein n=1 Tax=Ensete ventricosum TaxID=4639 RepID=A0A426WW19_ENSVE|nr:hypothetical protein B296_00055926 [Ensete ventricosum]
MGLPSLACMHECSALLALALGIGAGDGNLFSYRRVGSGGRLLRWAISPLRSLRGEWKADSRSCDQRFQAGNQRFQAWKGGGSSPLGAGWTLGRETMEAALRLGLGSLSLCNPAATPAFEFLSVFRASSRKFKILAIPDVLAHGKLYEHGFKKKCDGHKLCAKVEFRSVLREPSRKFKILVIHDVLAHVEFRSVFHVPSQKFKILVFPVLLAHGNSYKHAFTKKYDGHKLCPKLHAESSFDRFFMHRLGNSKYWPFTMY